LKASGGYTFYEHYDKLGLINMNGRVYDPQIKGFNNDNYNPPGVPKWAWWWLATGASYDFYENWPTPGSVNDTIGPIIKPNVKRP